MMPTMEEIAHYWRERAERAEAERDAAVARERAAVHHIKHGDMDNGTCMLNECALHYPRARADQPEYPSTADDEATRWRHGEPIGEVLSVQENKVVPNETFTVIVPHGKTAPPAGTKVFAQPERVSVPREPTPEMWDAAWTSIGLPYRAKLSMHEIKILFEKFHEAMLAAAPKEAR